jgi:hypothetical protein
LIMMNREESWHQNENILYGIWMRNFKCKVSMNAGKESVCDLDQ